MIPTAAQTYEPVTPATLLDRTRALKKDGWRLVQISATRLPEAIELTYSFDRQMELANLRMLTAPAIAAPSISSVFWCAILYENEIHDLFGLPIEGIAVDFKGNFYKTTVKHAFGSTKIPGAVAVPAAPATTPKPPVPGTPSPA